jgi:hypothetical protein
LNGLQGFGDSELEGKLVRDQRLCPRHLEQHLAFNPATAICNSRNSGTPRGILPTYRRLPDWSIGALI